MGATQTSTGLPPRADSAPKRALISAINQAGGSAIQGERFLPGDITIDAGDSVTWKANSTEPHTVTFFGGGVPQDTLTEFNPGDPQQNAVQGPDAMDGASYFNSGVNTPDGTLELRGESQEPLTELDLLTYCKFLLVAGTVVGMEHAEEA